MIKICHLMQKNARYILVFYCLVFQAQNAQAQTSHSNSQPFSMGRIVVLGDKAAFQFSNSLRETLGNKAIVDYVGQPSLKDGFMGGDWIPYVKTALENREKPFALIVFLSYNGQREGGIVELSGQQFYGNANWEKVVFPLMEKIKNSQVPFLWVSSPPIPNEHQSEMIDRINIAVREKLPQQGFFVDIWPAFSDEDGRFQEKGSDVEGKVVPLRDEKGFGFTPAGTRKIAYFVSLELEQLRKDMIYFQEQRQANSGQSVTPAGGQSVNSPMRPLSANTIVPEEQVVLEPPTIPVGSSSLTIRAMHEGIPAPFRQNRGDDVRWRE